MSMLPATGLVGARKVRNFLDMATARHRAGLPLTMAVRNSGTSVSGACPGRADPITANRPLPPNA